MKIILKGSQRQTEKHILYPHRHRHIVSPRFFCWRMNSFFFGESVRLGWAKWVFRCVSNEFIYIIFGIACYLCALIHKMIQCMFYSTVFWECTECTVQTTHCSLGSFIIPFPFVSLCLSMQVVACVYVSVSDAFLCHLHTLHYVSGVRCIFFDYLASLHSVGGSGCFLHSTFSLSLLPVLLVG